MAPGNESMGHRSFELSRILNPGSLDMARILPGAELK